MNQHTILYSGHIAGNQKLIDYLERLNRYLNQSNYRLFLVNLGGREVSTNCDAISLPEYIQKGSAKDRKKLSHTEIAPELLHAAGIDLEFHNQQFQVCLNRLVLYKAFMEDVFRREKPNLCVMAIQFTGYHMVLRYVCEQYMIPFLYQGGGVLPGTICFEPEGQMAESWVTQKNDRFLALPVAENDLVMASRYLSIARERRLSRKPQSQEGKLKQHVADLRRKKRKIVFYAGQNDYRSGIWPNWLPKASVHSPFFYNTFDALQYLLRLAPKNNWHILFKPHPNIREKQLHFEPFCSESLSYVTGANIFECMYQSDITVTILSQVSYLALIHNRPIVLLGRNQLSGKGCTYEITSRERTEEAILDALQGKEGDERYNNWMKHVAQVLKYYVFAWDEEIIRIIGRDVDEVARYLIMHCGFPETLYAAAIREDSRLWGAKGYLYDLRRPIAGWAKKILPQGIYVRLGDFYRRIPTNQVTR